MSTIRIGCVPYLNGVPLISWFQTDLNTTNSEVIFEVPSQLALRLRRHELDVALVSIFESFLNPALRIVPDISISADGYVKSVRLFSRVPFSMIRSVALDTSSLTSCALTKIILAETYHIEPDYIYMPPDPSLMLAQCDACLIIGDLKLFDTPAEYILDMGEAWKNLTGLPFVYAAWLANPTSGIPEMDKLLMEARMWGEANLSDLVQSSSRRMMLSVDMVEDYLLKVMQYDLNPPKDQAIDLFHQKCLEHGLLK
jgi:chorismate dehydratase